MAKPAGGAAATKLPLPGVAKDAARVQVPEDKQ